MTDFRLVRDRSGLRVALALSVAFLAVGWLRHRNHWTAAFDLGFFDQAVWQLSRGHVHSSLLGRSILSDHLSPILFAFAPLYRLAPTPFWLIAAQALALGMTVLPMRAVALRLGASPVIATLLVVCSPPLWAAALFDFHPSALAVPAVALAVLAGVRDDRRLAVLAGVGVILCRADLGVVLLGVAIISRPRARLALLVLGLGGSVVGALVPDLLGNPGGWDAYYSHLGTGPVDAALHPWRVASALVDPTVLALVLGWLLAVGFLPLFKPRWVLATVVAALPTLLSGFPGPTLPWFHHGASYVPLLIGGALATLGEPPTFLRRVPDTRRLAFLGTSVALALLLVSPFSPEAPGSTQLWRSLRQGRDASPALQWVQPDDVVSASARIVPQLSQRPGVHLYPLPFEQPATTFPSGLAPPARRAEQEAVDVIVLERVPGKPVPAVDGFEVVHIDDGVVVLRRSNP